MANVNECLDKKVANTKAIWTRMQDPNILDKIKVKVRPEILEREVNNFKEALAEAEATGRIKGNAVTDDQVALAKEVLKETTRQLERRHNQASHMASVIARQQNNISGLIKARASNPDKVVDGLLHAGVDQGAYSVEGMVQGNIDFIARQNKELLSKLSNAGRLMASSEDKAFGDVLGDSLFGMSKGEKYTGTDPDLPIMLEGLKTTSENIADGYFARGLDVRKLNGAEYFLRADWNHERVGAIQKGEFVEKAFTLKNHIDWDRMGGSASPETMARLSKDGQTIDPELFFGNLYDKIVLGEFEMTDMGQIATMAGRIKGAEATKVGRAREFERQIFFNSYAGWKAFSETFGNGGNFSAHVANMLESSGRTLGILDAFGVQPQKTLQYISGKLHEELGYAYDGKAKARIEQEITNGYRYYSGRMLDNSGEKYKSYVRGLKFNIRASMLGTDPLSSVTTETMGLMPNALSILGEYNTNKAFGAAEALINGNGAEARMRAGAYVGEIMRIAKQNFDGYTVTGYERTMRKAAHAVDEVAGSTTLSEKNKSYLHWAFENGLIDVIRTNGDRNVINVLDSITDKPFLSYLHRQGLTNKDLKTLAKYIKNIGTDKNPLHVFDFESVTPSSTDHTTVVKYNATKAVYQNSGSPGSNQRLNYKISKAAEAGGVAGHLAQFVQFASYAENVRNLALPTTRRQGIAHTAGFVLWMTALGMLDVQLRQAVMFKSPRQLDGYLVAEGFQRAALGGVLGDVLYNAGQNPRDGILEKAIPIIGTAKKTLGEFNRQGKRIIDGKFSLDDAAYGLTKNLLGELLPGKNIWYTKALFQRAVLDNLKEAIDPHRYREEVSRSKARTRKDGQELYWQRGELLPGSK